MVFQILKENALSLNLDKCVFAEKSIPFLGHILSVNGFEPDPAKLTAIANFPKPQTVSQIRSFCGLVNFYHRFIPHCSAILADLTGQISGPKHAKVTLTEAAIKSFETAKAEILKITKLAYPLHSAPYTLTTDASDFALGAVLQQEQGDELKPIAFFSRKMSQAQMRYSTFDRELLAIFTAVKDFDHFLITGPFTIYTDHKPLTHMFELKHPSPRQQRQLSYLSQFDCKVLYTAGKENVVADALSRCAAIVSAPLFPNEVLLENAPTTEDIDHFKDSVTVFNGIPFDTSLSGVMRPIIAQALREKAFFAMHNVHHPGFRGTHDLLRTRVVWPFLQRDVKRWCKECTHCQSCKTSRHIKPPFRHFPTSETFETIHIDLVGPLPVCDGKQYLLTIIDRKSRWPEAIPIRSMTAPTVVKYLVETWFARYGVPHTIISDQGSQFESELFQNLAKQYGFIHNRTSAYHPQTNGMIERFHRKLKTSLRTLATTSNWVKALPLVMLGWRNTISKSTNCSPAQMLFGHGLAMPGELVRPVLQPPREEIENARKYFNSLDTNPSESQSTNGKFFVPKDIKEADFLWLEAIQPRSLAPRYTGPYKVITIDKTNATILVHEEAKIVNLARVKPAYGYVETSVDETETVSPNQHNQRINTLPTEQPISSRTRAKQQTSNENTDRFNESVTNHVRRRSVKLNLHFTQLSCSLFLFNADYSFALLTLAGGLLQTKGSGLH